MKIIISPAKRMKVLNDEMEVTPAHFEKEAIELRNYLKSLSFDELKNIWKCNDDIVKENMERFEEYNLDSSLTPAILAYDGIQYKNMAPKVFDEGSWNYVKSHLCIISALYGLLKPTDGVIPYRLEMQARIALNGVKTMYKYWGDKIYKYLTHDDHVILNLASQEYFDAIEPFLTSEDKVITCSFCNVSKNKLVQRSTASKSCRGAMVRFMGERNIEDLEEIKKFNELGFVFSEEDSTETNFVFVNRK